MPGVLDYLFQSAQPAATGAPDPSAQGANAPVAQDGAAPQQGMLSGLTPDQAQALIAKARPGLLDTLLGGFQGRKGSFDQIADQIQQERLNREMAPFGLVQKSQAMAYGQNIQDPALKNLYLTDPAAYAEVMKTRLSAHDTGAGVTTTGLGDDGSGSVNGSVVSSPGQTVGDTGGRTYQTNAPGPMDVAPGNSVYDPVSRTFKQAPAAKQVVTSKVGDNVDIVDPNAPPTSPQTPSGPLAAPRGVSNNNPFNIKSLSGGQLYSGQVGMDGPFAKFSSMQAGMQAADRLLQSKQALHGFSTLNQVIADPKYGWDPGNAQYAQDVAASMGVKPDAPLNLADSTVRATILHGMMPHEIGAPAAAKVTGAPSPAPGVTSIRTATPPQQVSPDEAQARGLAPGVWFKNPDGTLSNPSPAPKGDVERVNNLTAAASTMDDLNSLDQQFMQAADRTKPGLQYAGGKHNPVAMIAEHVNPDVKSMESISAQELFKMKPENAGARILQSELPFWERSALDPGSSYEANQGLAAQHASQRSQIQTKANFYQTWIYQHGNLNGADQAWAKARPQIAPAPQASPSGFKIVGQR